MLANIAGLIFQKKNCKRPSEEHDGANRHQCRLEAVLRRDGPDEKWTQTTEQPNPDIYNSQRPAALFSEPIGNQYLMRNRPAKYVTDRINEIQQIIDSQRSLHGTEAEKRNSSQACTHNDKLAGTEMRNQNRPDPYGQDRGEREAQCNLPELPVEALLKIIVEEGLIIVRNPDSDAERNKGRRNH